MLFGLPMALWSTLGSAVMGFITKTWAQTAQDRAAERKHERDTWAAVARHNKESTEQEVALLKARTEFHKATNDPHTSMTRRGLAIMAMAIFASVPFLVLFGGIGWFEFVTTTVKNSGFLFFGGSESAVTNVITGHGVPLAWLGTLDVIIGAVVGFYFGTNAAKRENPFK